MTGLRVVGVVLLLHGVTLAAALAAQSAPRATQAEPLTDQQLRGEALFSKNCALCHSVRRGGTSIELAGLFRRSSVTEDAVLTVIRQGRPKKMPGFRFTLDSKDIDDVIAYLKSR